MKKFFIITADSIKAFSYDNCLTMAAAISFYALFSLLPLMFLLFSFIGFTLGTETRFFEQVLEFVKKSLPYLSDSIVGDIKGLITNRKVFGWFGIITLIWSAEFVILAIRDAMNIIFGEAEKMGFVKTRLVVWGTFFIWCAVFLISIGLPLAAKILSRIKIAAFGIDISYYLARSVTFKYFMPVVIMVIAVAFIFKIMVGKNIKARHAILGSIIFSVLWEAAKQLFALYITHFGSFNKMYGSLGAIMIMLLWIFYSAIILLFSAEFIASVKAPRK